LFRCEEDLPCNACSMPPWSGPRAQENADKVPAEPSPLGDKAAGGCGLSFFRRRRAAASDAAPLFAGSPEQARQLLEHFVCPITHVRSRDAVYCNMTARALRPVRISFLNRSGAAE